MREYYYPSSMCGGTQEEKNAWYEEEKRIKNNYKCLGTDWNGDYLVATYEDEKGNRYEIWDNMEYGISHSIRYLNESVEEKPHFPLSELDRTNYYDKTIKGNGAIPFDIYKIGNKYFDVNGTEVNEDGTDKITESSEMNAEEFVSMVSKMKELGIWDGKDDTFADAVKKYNGIKDVNDEMGITGITESKVTTPSGEYDYDELAGIEENIKKAFKDFWNGKITGAELEDLKKKSGLSQGEISSLQYQASREEDLKEDYHKNGILTEADDDFEEDEDIEDDIDIDIDLDKDVEEDDEEPKSILDLIQDRIGQDISVGELNTMLQSIFGKYNEVFLLSNMLYNADIDEPQDLVVWDDDDMYTITFNIKDIEEAIIEITDVVVE